jgi:hypothetical protein
MSSDGRAELIALLQRLATGDGRPHDLGLEVWALSMGKVSPDGDWIDYPLWPLWGGLTDWVERKTAETAQAEQAMVESAQEFLCAAGHEDLERAYFDRWLYDRLGYTRPAAADTP